MIRSWSIGDIRVTNLVEYFGPTHDPRATFPEFDPVVGQIDRLPPGHYVAQMDRFVIAIQVWLVFAGDRIIVVDTGVGNFKPRPAARMNMLNTLVPAWLNAAGASREAVTDVVMTHLHSDHIGWNTTLEDGRWVPTFPKARYHVPKKDFEFFRDLNDTGKAGDTSFADSLMPVLEAGLVDFVDQQKDLAGCLSVAEAYGHTPGQLNYWLRSKGETGVFSADILHHPVQILNPGWNTAFCILPDEAKRTRAAFLAKAADTNALVMPCHFPPPHCGYVRRQGDGYAYEPARQVQYS
jgi:glyoxylase-like metal-dependent hydrolase (beta-lactamase superfamily II)